MRPRNRFSHPPVPSLPPNDADRTSPGERRDAGNGSPSPGDEQLDPELVRGEVAGGRMVIPANRVHLGKASRADRHRRRRADEDQRQPGQFAAFERHRSARCRSCDCAIRYGADTVMDLSTGPDIDAIRRRMIDASPVPVGTVPIYQMAEQLDDIVDMTAPGLSRRGRAPGPAGRRLHDDPLRAAEGPRALTERRVTGIVSRGGSLVAKWMTVHDRGEPVLHQLRRPVRHHARVRRHVEPGRRPAAGLASPTPATRPSSPSFA